MGNQQNYITQETLTNFYDQITAQISKLKPTNVIVKVDDNVELQQKINENQNKILEQQMKLLANGNKMTQVKEEAFQKYCALSFEQQLYSIIKYGLRDPNEITISVTTISFQYSPNKSPRKSSASIWITYQQNSAYKHCHRQYLIPVKSSREFRTLRNIEMEIVIQNIPKHEKYEDGLRCDNQFIYQILNNTLIKSMLRQPNDGSYLDYKTMTLHFEEN